MIDWLVKIWGDNIMKKRISVLVLVLALLTGLIGCSTNEKSEEELKAELKAEIKAEMGKEQQNKSEERKEGSAEEQLPKENEAKKEEPDSGENDIFKGYSYNVEDGDLKLTYNNTGNTVTLINTYDSYNILKNDGNGQNTYNIKMPKVLSAKKSTYDDKRIFFTVEAQQGIFPAIFYIELNKMEIHFLNSGEYVTDVSLSNDSHYAILAQNKNGTKQYYAYDTLAPWEPACELGHKLEKDLKAQIKRSLEKVSVNPTNNSDVLIESNGSNYYKYKSNESVYFDIDRDGADEEIVYDTAKGRLMVSGYEGISIDTMFAEREYFNIIKFSDKYDTKMGMIGILDYGPSSDIVTNLYSVIEPRGEKTFVSVGSVPGEIVTPSNFDGDNIDDFNYKAVLYDGRGIEAPVRLSILGGLQTWYGRNLFTYYTTYFQLMDNNNKYERDYETRISLRTKNAITAYEEKDFNSNNFTIKGGQVVYLLATDNKEWIGMISKNETMGWVNVKDVTERNFSGFSVFD